MRKRLFGWVRTAALTKYPEIQINGMYCRSTAGTGTWTRALAGALPGCSIWKPRFDPAAENRYKYARKLAFEMAFRLRNGRWHLHPYWAAAIDPGAIITILDLVAYREAPAWQKRLLLGAAQRAAIVTTISEFSRSDVETEIGRPATVLTPHPDPAFFGDLAAWTGTREFPIKMAYWGGWHPRKGIVEFLLALKGSDLNFEMHCTGQSPVSDPRIISHGDLGTLGLVKLIDTCAVAVYPSQDEGFGLPVNEALLRGKPAIVRPLDVYREFVVVPEHSLVYLDAATGNAVGAVHRALELSHQATRIRRTLRFSDHASARANLAGEVAAVLSQLTP